MYFTCLVYTGILCLGSPYHSESMGVFDKVAFNYVHLKGALKEDLSILIDFSS